MVNRIMFHTMGQERNKLVTAFVAQLHGQSNLCNFNVTSTCSGCTLPNTFSYQDNIITHQLGRALADPDIQERMMSAHGDDKDTTMKQIIMFVEAQEMGRHNQSLLTDSGGLNRVSEYRSGKATVKQESRPQATPATGAKACSNCCSKTH